jgi:hypothetical protein
MKAILILALLLVSISCSKAQFFKLPSLSRKAQPVGTGTCAKMSSAISLPYRSFVIFKIRMVWGDASRCCGRARENEL